MTGRGPAGRAGRPAAALIGAMLLWLVLGLEFATGAAAQNGLSSEFQDSLNVFDAQASAIERQLEDPTLERGSLSPMIATLVGQRDALPVLQTRVANAITPLRSQLDAIGPAPEDGVPEDEAVARERAALAGQLATLEGTRRRLDQADARAAALIDRINTLRQRLLSERLRTRGEIPLSPPVLHAALDGLGALVAQIGGETRSRLLSDEASALSLFLRIVAPLVIVAITAAVLLFFRRAADDRLTSLVRDDLSAGRKIAIGLGLTIARLLIPLVAIGIITTVALSSGLLGIQGRALIGGIGVTAVVAIAVHALAGAYFAPDLPALRLSNLDNTCARSAQRFSIILGVVWGLDRMLVDTADGLDLPAETQIAINFGLLIAGALALWGFERAIGSYMPIRSPGADREDEEDADAEVEESALTPVMINIGRMLLLAVAAIAPVLSLAGYFVASRFIFYNPLATAALIGTFVLIFALVRSSVAAAVSMVRGEETETARRDPEDGRLQLIPIVIGFALVCAAVPLIAMIWGADRGDLITAWQALRAGVRVGDINVAPRDFVAFLVIFGVVLLFFKLIKAVLARSVLPVTGLDAGARAAVVSGTGYVGWVVAGLVAVAGVGLDLSNVAIVAGALSVGIGFGLQAIVNNFVSGLILLIERPIKVGDWVQLPSGMGYVKRVSVRATEIETFDRASLIVPNSELISSTVQNWTHTNLHGRVIVPVRVTLDTDPRAVELLLVEIARNHPQLLRRPQPFVLFTGYNDYAITMELRAILRDVNWILNVKSDLYFEINRRFAEAGIRVPVQAATVTLSGGPADAAIPAEPPLPRRPSAGPQPGDGGGDGAR